MKKNILNIAALALTTLAINKANAQVFTLEYLHNSDDTIHATGTPADLKAIVKLNLESGIDSFDYVWKFSSFSKPEDWVFNGMCDNVICHPYTIGGNISNNFKAPFADVNASIVYNSSNNDPMFNLDIPYLWFTINPAASIGIGYFKYSITTNNVYPVASAPATPQVVEITHIIKKSISSGVSVDRIAISNNDIQLFPNPAQNTLTIKTVADYNISKVNILDATGRVIATTPIKNQQVDITTLGQGIYLMEFVNNDGISLTTRKFVKQ